LRSSFALLSVLFLLSISSAYTLTIKVTVTQDTLSVGSNVSLVTNGIELASGRTGSDGMVNFSVSNGSYFALLKSSIYPLQVSLIEVRGDTSVTLTKRQLISYASAYGQISGPQSFSNASVTAFQDGQVAKRISPNADGYYVLSFIPDGTYDLSFEAPDYEKGTARQYLPQGEFTEVNMRLQKVKPTPEPEPTLSAPAQVQQSEIIEVALSKGGSPLSGETIIAETPAGKVELTTDPQGKAAIGAAQPGLYRFTFSTLSASTTVPAKEVVAPPKQQPQEPVEIPAPPVAPLPAPAPEQPLSGRALFAAIALFFILLFVGLLALLVWMKFISPSLAKAKAKEEKELREQVKHEHPPAHKKARHHKGKK